MHQEDTRLAGGDLSPEAEEDLYAGEGYPDMARVCRILARQVETLDAMFHHVRGLALQEDGPTEAYERLSRLAFRAQAQTARTAAVLGRLVPPPPAPEREPDDMDLFEQAIMKDMLSDEAEFIAAMTGHKIQGAGSAVAPQVREGDHDQGGPGSR